MPSDHICTVAKYMKLFCFGIFLFCFTSEESILPAKFSVFLCCYICISVLWDRANFSDVSSEISNLWQPNFVPTLAVKLLNREWAVEQQCHTRGRSRGEFALLDVFIFSLNMKRGIYGFVYFFFFVVYFLTRKMLGEFALFNDFPFRLKSLILWSVEITKQLAACNRSFSIPPKCVGTHYTIVYTTVQPCTDHTFNIVLELLYI